MKDAIQKGFPAAICFPHELELLCEWAGKHGDQISGYFELRADDGEAIYWWFRSHDADDRLAQFGAGADGSLYCIWKQDDGREPVVHMGSEGDALMVLAGTMKEFIRLLAVGYGELGFEDVSVPPEEPDDINLGFQNWVEDIFDVTVPATGQEIVDRAHQEYDNFQGFVEAIPKEEG